MPCYYTGSREGDLELSFEEKRKALTEVTEMLCNLLRTLEQDNILADEFDTIVGSSDKKILNWWKKHKKIDSKAAKRNKQEELRKTALSKLTLAEKKALRL